MYLRQSTARMGSSRSSGLMAVASPTIFATLKPILQYHELLFKSLKICGPNAAFDNSRTNRCTLLAPDAKTPPPLMRGRGRGGGYSPHSACAAGCLRDSPARQHLGQVPPVVG